MKRIAYTASNWTIHAWAFGGLADYWMSAVIYSFLSIVFITSFEMNPLVVTTALMLPRLVDIVVDPLLGRLSDNTHTRWGRRRPFIFATTVVGAVLSVAIWWMPLQWTGHWMGFAFLLVIATLLYADLGAFQMSHVALGYELSDDYHQRSKVQAARSFYFAMGSLGGGYTYWLAQRHVFARGLAGAYSLVKPQHAGEIHGFRILSLAMAALILFAGLLATFKCQERFQDINRKHVNIGQALKATLSCRPFVVILAMRFINVLGGTLFGALSAYVGIYSVCQGNKEWYNNVVSGWNGISGFVLGFAMVPLAAPITRWLGKRRGIIWCYGISCFSAVLTPFIMRPGNPYLWFWVGLAFAPVGTVLGNLLASVIPDICDLDELKHGERREGLFTAVMSFMTKLESSVCGWLGGLLLVFSGFDQHLIQQPQNVLDKMRLYAFIPLIVGAFLTFAAACFFPMTKKMMDAVRLELDARHAAAHIPEPDMAAV